MAEILEDKKEWEGKTGGGNIGQKTLFFYFRYGSIPLSYFFMGFVVFFYLIKNREEAQNIYSYFRTKIGYSPIKSVLSTYRNHFLFGKTIIDKFAMFAGRKEEYKIEVEGNEVFHELADNPDKGAILINSHVGSAEIAGYVLKQEKKKFYALVYGGEVSAIQQYRAKILAEKNIFMIPVTDGFSHIFDLNNALKGHNFISIAGDRVYTDSKNLKFNFLGEQAAFPIGPFLLATKMKVPLMFSFVMQEGYKSYHCYVKKVMVEEYQYLTKDQQIEYVMQRYVSSLEEILKKYPLQWYNFYKFWN